MLKFSKVRLPLYMSILIGMALGVAFGILAYNIDATEFVKDWVAPFGDIFMRMLKAIAIPLVFISLVKGVSNIGNISALSRMGGRTLLIYVCTTIVAITLGLILVTLISPGSVVDAQNASTLHATYSDTIAERTATAEALNDAAPLQWLIDIVPDNVVGAMANNGSMLQVIFVAILIGVAVILAGKERTAPFVGFIDSLDTIVMKIIDIIMQFAPVGVFALMGNMVVTNAGDMQLIGALGLYFVTVVVGLFALILGFYPLLVKLFTDTPIREFYRKMIPVQLLAFTTSSSAAVLPLNMETLQRELGVREKTASFVLPVGATINMDGTSLYQAIGAVFIAQVLGMDLSFTQILTILATTT
ncbi:MAG: dicarboxylate/amino acid:cation symporter, partial [Rikenellaceae bacterium]